MLDPAKYIVLDMGMLKGEQIFIFSSSLGHDEVAKKLGGVPVSAGNVTITDRPGAICHGCSTSLRVRSRDSDSIMANIALGLT